MNLQKKFKGAVIFFSLTISPIVFGDIFGRLFDNELDLKENWQISKDSLLQSEVVPPVAENSLAIGLPWGSAKCEFPEKIEGQFRIRFLYSVGKAKTLTFFYFRDVDDRNMLYFVHSGASWSVEESSKERNKFAIQQYSLAAEHWVELSFEFDCTRKRLTFKIKDDGVEKILCNDILFNTLEVNSLSTFFVVRNNTGTAAPVYIANFIVEKIK